MFLICDTFPQIVRKHTVNDLRNSDLRNYCYGIVELEEDVAINATIVGIWKKEAKALREQLPLPVHPYFAEKDGYTTLFFELNKPEQV